VSRPALSARCGCSRRRQSSRCARWLRHPGEAGRRGGLRGLQSRGKHGCQCVLLRLAGMGVLKHSKQCGMCVHEALLQNSCLAGIAVCYCAVRLNHLCSP
jgi:hypothetical protein